MPPPWSLINFAPLLIADLFKCNIKSKSCPAVNIVKTIIMGALKVLRCSWWHCCHHPAISVIIACYQWDHQKLDVNLMILCCSGEKGSFDACLLRLDSGYVIYLTENHWNGFWCEKLCLTSHLKLPARWEVMQAILSSVTWNFSFLIYLFEQCFLSIFLLILFKLFKTFCY